MCYTRQASKAFEDAEFERLCKLKVCMKSFCDLERAALASRGTLLTSLEEVVNEQVPDEDILSYVGQERQVELTHKYTHALELMDYYYKQK